MHTLLRPDDTSARGQLMADIPAGRGERYQIEKRGSVLRLARVQENGVAVSVAFSPSDARRVATALIAASWKVEQ